jgi:inner membrane protein
LLTFVTFFCFEILGSKKRIHPIQYIFIGLALVVFYVLLIALAEYVGFEMAYLGGAVATIVLITTYSYNILKSKKLAAAVFSLLTFIYIYLYTLLQMEENSLLIGAVSLFLVLATIMFVTRNVDWYLDSGKESSN